jgi:polar amino acid transport system ATP-binding protein
MPRDEAAQTAHELLARFGLAGRADDYPHRLSGGQQQRVAIIRALATRPRALLRDEITSALDPELVSEVLELVRELNEQGMTMLIATHEMSFARDFANEVRFLHEGRILERGEPERLLASPELPETQQFLRRLLGQPGV